MTSRKTLPAARASPRSFCPLSLRSLCSLRFNDEEFFLAPSRRPRTRLILDTQQRPFTIPAMSDVTRILEAIEHGDPKAADCADLQQSAARHALAIRQRGLHQVQQQSDPRLAVPGATECCLPQQVRTVLVYLTRFGCRNSYQRMLT